MQDLHSVTLQRKGSIHPNQNEKKHNFCKNHPPKNFPPANRHCNDGDRVKRSAHRLFSPKNFVQICKHSLFNRRLLLAEVSCDKFVSYGDSHFSTNISEEAAEERVLSAGVLFVYSNYANVSELTGWWFIICSYMRLVAPSHATQTQLYRAVVQRLLGPESKPRLAPGLSVPGLQNLPVSSNTQR